MILMGGKSFLYIASSGRFVKVGITDDYVKRMPMVRQTSGRGMQPRAIFYFKNGKIAPRIENLVKSKFHAQARYPKRETFSGRAEDFILFCENIIKGLGLKMTFNSTDYVRIL